jgi:alpha-mannosidase
MNGMAVTGVKEMPVQPLRPHIRIIATQHLDVAYLWPRHPDGEDLMRQCFERAIEMIEADPHARFVFSRSTAWSFHIIEQQHPTLFEQIKRYVGLGRIELCGGQWVEPDNIIPDGETLVRQSLYGQGYFQSRFGQTATVGWNPDAFAHGHTLPQILRLSGLEGYYFHRCQPLDERGNGVTQFIWEGLDGSRLYAFSGKWRGKPDAGELAACIREMERTGLPMDFVATGANSDRRVTMEVDWMPALAHAREETGIPLADWAHAGDVVEDMRSYRDRLPTIKGELGFQFTGTYTSEGRIKRCTRRTEALLADAEKASACASLLGYPYPQQALSEAWRDLCVNTFHDIVCGTCYQHVHEEALALFQDVEARGKRLQEQALRFIAAQVETRTPEPASGGSSLLVFNTLSWARRGPVFLTPPASTVADIEAVEVVGGDGTIIASQVVMREDGSQGVVFVPPDDLPGLSYARFHVRTGAPSVTDAPDPSFRLENEYLLADVDPETGALDRLFDKRTGTELLAPRSKGNRLVFREDRSALPNYEPWYIGYTGKVLDTGHVEHVRMVEDGPVRSCIRAVRRAQLDPELPLTEIVQEIVLYHDLPYLVFQTRGNWQARRALLKTEFDLSFSCSRVACEMPYGVAERAPHLGHTAFLIRRDSAGEDGMEAGTTTQEPDRPMQRWLDFSDGTRGVAFVNNGKYGYDASGNQVRISLMRAPIHRDGEPIGLGPFAFSYALLAHEGDWREAGLPRHGYAFNHELVSLFANVHAGLSLEVKSAYRVEDPGVLITAIKQREAGGGIVLRLYESLERPVVTRLTSMRAVASVQQCDLLEAPLPGDSRCQQLSAHAVEVTLRPFEIVTVALQHAD